MNAALAYGFIYQAVIGPLDEEDRLKVEELLGDANATIELANRRRESAGFLDLDVG